MKKVVTRRHCNKGLLFGICIKDKNLTDVEDVSAHRGYSFSFLTLMSFDRVLTFTRVSRVN